MSINTPATIDFHGNQLFIIEHQHEPFTPMKPIIEGMGLDWAAQYRKLSANKERWVVVMLTMTVVGQRKEVVCMPVRKLPAFFASISVNKVREDLRATIILFQTECDDVLWKYWTGQQVQREHKPVAALPAPDSPITPEERRNLHNIMDAKVKSMPKDQQGGMHAQGWTRFNRKFKIAKYEQLPQSRYGEAVEYLIDMELRPGKKQEQAPLPTAPKRKALPPVERSFAERIEEPLARLLALRTPLYQATWDITAALGQPFSIAFVHKTAPAEHMVFVESMNYAIQHYCGTVRSDLQMIETLTAAYIGGEKILMGIGR